MTVRRSLATGLLVGLAVWILLALARTAAVTVPDAAPPHEPDVHPPAEQSATATRTLEGRQAISTHRPKPAIPAALTDRGVWLTVVDAKSRSPVPGARVLYYEGRWQDLLANPNTRREYSRLARDRLALLTKFGTTVITDADGRAAIPIPSHDRRCAAHHGRHYGELDLTEARPGDHLALPIEADSSLRIVVVDDSDQPVPGIGVTMARELVGPRGKSLVPLIVGNTAGSGELVVPHIQERQRRWPVDAAGQRWTRIAPAVFGGASRAMRVVADELPDRVRLRLPATGRVEVRLRDRRGRMVSDSHEVRCFVAGDTHPTLIRKPVRGRVSIAHVATGQQLRFEVGYGDARQVVRQRGPIFGDEVVELEIRIPVVDRLLIGRVLDAELRPLAHAVAWIELESTTGEIAARAAGDTDAGGSFRLGLVGGVELEHRPVARVRVTVGTRVLEGVCLVPERLSGGENRVGDVHVRAAQALVRGRVAGPGGRGIAGASVSVEPVAAAGDMPRWRATTNANGLFAVHGVDPGGMLRLRVRARGHAAPAPIEFAVGTPPVRVKLDAGADLRISIQLDEGVDPDALQIDVAGAAPTRRVRTKTRDGWELTVFDLPPGAQQLVARSQVGIVSTQPIELIRGKDRRVLLDLRGVQLVGRADQTKSR